MDFHFVRRAGRGLKSTSLQILQCFDRPALSPFLPPPLLSIYTFVITECYFFSGGVDGVRFGCFFRKAEACTSLFMRFRYAQRRQSLYEVIHVLCLLSPSRSVGIASCMNRGTVRHPYSNIVFVDSHRAG